MKALSKMLGFLMVIAALTIQANPSWATFNKEDRLIRNIYAPFSTLLDKYLIEKSLEEGGLITAFDYAKASADSVTESLLGEQNRLLADFDAGQINSRELALAFWTNAYNYFMIAHILENPLKGELVGSVRDYGSLFKPYRIFGQKNFNVGGRKYSLDEIEKDILKVSVNTPRSICMLSFWILVWSTRGKKFKRSFLFDSKLHNFLLK